MFLAQTISWHPSYPYNIHPFFFCKSFYDRRLKSEKWYSSSGFTCITMYSYSPWISYTILSLIPFSTLLLFLFTIKSLYTKHNLLPIEYKTYFYTSVMSTSESCSSISNADLSTFPITTSANLPHIKGYHFTNTISCSAHYENVEIISGYK